VATVAIFFPCLCGQPLRVDADRAGAPTRCPVCDRLVQAPSLQRANLALGIDAAPTAPAEEPVEVVPLERPAASPAVPAVRPVLLEETDLPPRPTAPTDREGPPVYRVADVASDPDAVARQMELKKARRWLAQAERDEAERRERERPWQLETRWYECLLYPLRAWLVVLGLAAAWATATAIVTLAAVLPSTWVVAELILRFPVLVLIFLLLGYTFAWLRATLSAAIHGRAGFVAWPARGLPRLARSGVEAVWSFLAGPAVLAAVAFFFWLNSGDFQWVDWLIVWELGLVAVGYWALVLMALMEGGRFRDASPVAVFWLVRDGGYRVPLAALGIAAVVVGHGLLALGAIEEMHRGPGGYLLLILCWASQLFWLLFVLRWLGVRRFHTCKARKPDQASAVPTLEEASAPRVLELAE
jgi:hypothetical protein